jgi:hypothetical protein
MPRIKGDDLRALKERDGLAFIFEGREFVILIKSKLDEYIEGTDDGKK